MEHLFAIAVPLNAVLGFESVTVSPTPTSTLYSLPRPVPGKYIIQTIKDTSGSTQSSLDQTAPLSMLLQTLLTKASLIDDLLAAKCSRITPSGLVTYHSLLAAPEKFEVLLPSYNSSFISILNDLWNNKPSHR